MALKGPPRTPEQILRLRGSNLPGRKGRKPDVPSPGGRPTCPSHFCRAEKAIWKMVMGHLEALNLLAKTDLHAIERYCVSMIRWRAAKIFLEENGSTYEKVSDSGSVFCHHPQVGEFDRLCETLRKLEMQFGLTPAARASLQVEPKPAADDLETFARKRG